jgi:hypothetical protein
MPRKYDDDDDDDNSTIIGIFIAMKIQVEIFWVVTPCSVVGGYKRFLESC